MHSKNFFCSFHHSLCPNNQKSLEELDFFNFLHFWDTLALYLIGDGVCIIDELLNNDDMPPPAVWDGGIDLKSGPNLQKIQKEFLNLFIWF